MDWISSLANRGATSSCGCSPCQGGPSIPEVRKDFVDVNLRSGPQTINSQNNFSRKEDEKNHYLAKPKNPISIFDGRLKKRNHKNTKNIKQPRKTLGIDTVLYAKDFDLPPAPIPENRDNIRIATFNTHLISVPFTATISASGFGFESEITSTNSSNRAKKIVENLNEDPYGFDVIFFNEVFSEDARSVLLSELSGTYPYFIDKIPPPSSHWYDQVGITENIGYDIIKGSVEDSGLMVFSRYPFVEISGKPTPQYVVFSEGTGLDAAASKGAVMVCILRPTKDENQKRKMYIIGTHLQSDDSTTAPSEYSKTIRESQLKEIENLIVKNIPPGDMSISKADILILGDLNINGSMYFDNFESPIKSVKQDNPPISSDISFVEYQEYWNTIWQRQMDNAIMFDVLRTTSPEDMGATHGPAPEYNAKRTERLDYILMNRFSTKSDMKDSLEKEWKQFVLDEMSVGDSSRVTSCPQWIRNIMHKAGSDHWGVAVDIGPTSFQCSPMIASHPEKEFKKYDSTKYKIITGNLKDLGSMQWYRFENPGTYSIGIIGSPEFKDPKAIPQENLIFEVFTANDLSFPVKVLETNPDKKINIKPCKDIKIERELNPKGCEIQLVTFPTMSGPFYVRVSSNPLRTGNYALVILFHDCSTKELACDIIPDGTHRIPKIPDPTSPFPVPGTPIETWFSMHVEKVSSGSKQSGAWKIFNVDNDIKVRLENKDGKILSDEFKPIEKFQAKGTEGTFEESEETVKYIVVERKSFFPVKGMPEASWKTNIVFLNADDSSISNIKADSETCGPGDDEITLTGTFDDVFLGDVYENDSFSVEDIHYIPFEKKSFTHRSHFDIVESDITGDDEGSIDIMASDLKEGLEFFSQKNTELGECGNYAIMYALRRSTFYKPQK